MSPLSAESDAIRQLLSDVRQTICDNQRFLERLKEDDTGLEVEDDGCCNGESSGDGEFEEL